MSKITFHNKSNITILLNIGNESYRLYPQQIQCVTADEAPFHFSLCPDSLNSLSYFIKWAGIISKRHFVLASDFQLHTQGDCEITLYTNTKKGKFRDEYEFCVPYCTAGNLIALNHSVRDGESFRSQLESASRNNNRALLLFDFFDILGNAIVGVLVLVIPFLLIWLLGSIQLAWDICSVAFIPIFIIIVLINRFFDKVKKVAWKKGKSFALRNQIFKDYNSYFEREYIFSVINKQ